MTQVTSTDTGIPIYAMLADRLRRLIHDGQYRAGDLIGSEHELARRESISRMTVRRASELLVNEGLVERRPGKGLYVSAAGVGTQLIQIVAGNLQWEPCLQVARGAQMAAKQLGIEVQMYDAHGDEEQDLQFVRRLPQGTARGAIVVSVHGPAFNEAVYSLKAEGFPFVLVDQRLHDINVSSVTADNYNGGFQATQVLLQAGHQRIAFVGDLVADTVRDRVEGMRDAIGDANLPFDRTLVVDVGVSRNRLVDWSALTEQCVRGVMARPNPPTALFCSCDAVARSAYRALAATGRRVPDDVSVIGFDDDPMAEWLTPTLTTVRQPFQEMGRAALDLLSKRISNPESPAENRVIPVELVRRESVAQFRN